MEEEVLQLEEGFLQRFDRIDHTTVDWIHPSYRDFVIQELQIEPEMAKHFLESCSTRGLVLAISVAGGASGDKQFPLMSSAKSWEILRARSSALIRESRDQFVIWEILGILRDAAESAEDDAVINARILRMLEECCLEAKKNLDELNEPINPFVMRRIYSAGMLVVPPPPLPSLLKSWVEVDGALKHRIEVISKEFLDSDAVSDWTTLLNIISKSDRRMLIQRGFPVEFASTFVALCSAIESELSGEMSLRGDEDFSSEISRLSEFSTAILELVGIIPSVDRGIKSTARKLKKRIADLEKKRSVLMSDNDRYIEASPQDDQRRSPPLDLTLLFSDL
jgi:hypothetical protein